MHTVGVFEAKNRLTALLDGKSVTQSVTRPTVTSPAQQTAALAAASPQVQLPASPQRSRRWLPYVVTAAMTLAASALFQLWPAPPVAPPRNVTVPVTLAGAAVSQVPTYVATLTKAADCRWQGEITCRPGMRLLPGELNLAAGRAELMFDGGAVLVMEGPARLNIESVTSAAIVAGKVLFRGDDSSDAFALHTPWSTLVDHGTEYAVVVAADREEIHVFDGEVIRTRRGVAADSGQCTPLNFAAGEARRFDPGCGSSGRSVPLDAKTFKICAECPPCNRNPNDDLLAYEPFTYDATSLPSEGKVELGAGDLGWQAAWVRSAKCEHSAKFAVVGDLWRPQMKSRRQGGAVSIDCRGGVSRQLTVPLSMNRDDVTYFSYLVRAERRPAEGPCDLQLMLRESSGTQRRWAVTVSWSAAKACICWEGGGNHALLPVEPGKTYLVAGKIITGRAAPDQTFLTLFSPRQFIDAEEPSSWTVVSRPVMSDAVFDVVQVAANTATPVSFDELRFGSSWNSVTAPYSHTDAERTLALEP